MAPRADVHEYCRPDGLYESTCTIPLAIVWTEIGVLDIDCTFVHLDKRTTFYFSSVSTGNLPRLTTFMFIVAVWLLTVALRTISIGTNCELYRAIFFLVRKDPFTSL